VTASSKVTLAEFFEAADDAKGAINTRDKSVVYFAFIFYSLIDVL
jgi:hypothetical protein